MLKRFTIAHSSMTPSLLPGDAIVAVRTARPPRRGAIIVFEAKNGLFVVKRVLALGGETIGASGGVVSVNGTPLDRWAVGLTSPFDATTVPDGHVWVMGDRRELSTEDSRTLGPIPVPTWWRATFRYHPISRLGWLR
jgi:signal peptidase I